MQRPYSSYLRFRVSLLLFITCVGSLSALPGMRVSDLGCRVLGLRFRELGGCRESL